MCIVFVANIDTRERKRESATGHWGSAMCRVLGCCNWKRNRLGISFPCPFSFSFSFSFSLSISFPPLRLRATRSGREREITRHWIRSIITLISMAAVALFLAATKLAGAAVALAVAANAFSYARFRRRHLLPFVSPLHHLQDSHSSLLADFHALSLSLSPPPGSLLLSLFFPFLSFPFNQQAGTNLRALFYFCCWIYTDS
jgi:hypothetical protein